jgi:DMSO/TMAO reductase YedYZ molybdopterin-dependent catalytic subunit
MKIRLSFLSLFFAVILANGHACAQTAGQAGITVQGEVPHPITLYAEDLAKMDRVTAHGKDRDGKEHVYSGVAIADILLKAGVPMGAGLRGDNMTKYLLVRSADGYEILFSLAELDSSYTDKTVLLADKMDGQPIPADLGPFRIIVPSEKKHARWTWKATTFIIRSAKE